VHGGSSDAANLVRSGELRADYGDSRWVLRRSGGSKTTKLELGPAAIKAGWGRLMGGHGAETWVHEIEGR
jgi:hypothetical protein